MKKIFVTLFIACLAVSAWAVEEPKSGFGLQIGWAQPILRLNSPSTAYPKDSLVNVTKLNGFKIGFVYDESYFAGFGSSMGINYTMAGGHTNWKSTSSYTEYPRSRTNTMYHEVEVFVDWQYKFELAKETYLMLYTGPTIQCGIAFNTTKTTQTQTITGEIVPTYDISNRYTTDEANDHLTRLNVTWGVGAGFQYQRYFLRGGYDFGIINPYQNKQFESITGGTSDRYTRGRLDQWTIKIGMYLWYDER